MRNTQKVHLSSAMLAAALITAGCSSSNSDSGPITKFGSINLDESEVVGGQSFAVAAFFDMQDNIAPFVHLLTTPSSDRCSVDGAPLSEEEEQANAIESTFISAGEIVTISSPSGTLGTLEQRAGEEGLVFYLPSQPLGDLPADLTLDIPGDAFPAMSNVAAPAEVTVDDLNYPADGLTEASEYTWTPTGAEGVTVHLEIDTGSTFIECEAIDDGSFVLPEEVVAQVGSFTDGEVDFAFTESQTMVRSGQALLLVIRSKDIPLL